MAAARKRPAYGRQRSCPDLGERKSSSVVSIADLVGAAGTLPSTNVMLRRSCWRYARCLLSKRSAENPPHDCRNRLRQVMFAVKDAVRHIIKMAKVIEILERNVTDARSRRAAATDNSIACDGLSDCSDQEDHNDDESNRPQVYEKCEDPVDTVSDVQGCSKAPIPYISPITDEIKRLAATLMKMLASLQGLADSQLDGLENLSSKILGAKQAVQQAVELLRANLEGALTQMQTQDDDTIAFSRMSNMLCDLSGGLTSADADPLGFIKFLKTSNVIGSIGQLIASSEEARGEASEKSSRRPEGASRDEICIAASESENLFGQASEEKITQGSDEARRETLALPETFGSCDADPQLAASSRKQSSLDGASNGHPQVEEKIEEATCKVGATPADELEEQLQPQPTRGAQESLHVHEDPKQELLDIPVWPNHFHLGFNSFKGFPAFPLRSCHDEENASGGITSNDIQEMVVENLLATQRDVESENLQLPRLALGKCEVTDVQQEHHMQEQQRQQQQQPSPRKKKACRKVVEEDALPTQICMFALRGMLQTFQPEVSTPTKPEHDSPTPITRRSSKQLEDYTSRSRRSSAPASAYPKQHRDQIVDADIDVGYEKSSRYQPIRDSQRDPVSPRNANRTTVESVCAARATRLPQLHIECSRLPPIETANLSPLSRRASFDGAIPPSSSRRLSGALDATSPTTPTSPHSGRPRRVRRSSLYLSNDTEFEALSRPSRVIDRNRYASS